MGQTLAFDLETNGLLDKLDRIHCLVIRDVDTGQQWSCHDHRDGGATGPSVVDGLDLLARADVILGHNIIGFDIPAIQKVHPEWTPRGTVRDTLVCTRLIWPEMKGKDWAGIKRKATTLPPKLAGSHSLEAWGHRLGVFKGDYGKSTHNTKEGDAWAEWSQEMQDYCEQDVEVTVQLWLRILKKKYSPQAVDLEHQSASICQKITNNGFPFNEKKASALYAYLVGRREEVANRVRNHFPGWWQPKGVETPKRSLKYKDPLKADRVEGASYTRVVWTEFNPGSRDHVAQRLQAVYGWVPTEYTDTGKPQVDETTLSKLPYPPAPDLAAYYLLSKRLGLLGDGRTSFLRQVRDGKLHQGIMSGGAVTGRATHRVVANIPRATSPYGRELRELFTVPPGWRLLGTDMSGLELRCLSHYMAPFDDGAYARAVVEGDSTQGTDVHSLNARALGWEPSEALSIRGKETTGRNVAKTFIYAYLYGAGDEKLGSIIGKGTSAGRKLRARFGEAVPALARLTKRVKEKSRAQGFLTGLDGRRLHVRSEHSALNTLLQSAGAVICKAWMVELERNLLSRGLRHGWTTGDFAFAAWVHDELQIGARSEDVSNVIDQTTRAVAEGVGAQFGFRVPLAADAVVGQNWAETH